MVSRTQWEVLNGLGNGWVLKSRRELNGKKEFVLQTPNGERKRINPKAIYILRKKGLVDSNKKFPVATFYLTDLGREILQES